MQYRDYGKTGEKISIISFGGMRLPDDDKEAYLLVRRACECGINYFDTAPSYCGWRSESIIGQAVKDSKKKVFLVNKSMVDYDPTESDLRKRLEASLKNMKTDKIDFYCMWDVSSWSKFEKVTKKGGPYEGALKAKKEGLIDHIILSTHADSLTIKKMLDADLFEGVTLGYNIINFEFRGDAVAAAAAKGIGIVTMNSLGGGVIPRIRNYLDKFCSKGNLNTIAIALKFILMTPGITAALSGVRSIKELEENVKIVDDEINYDVNEVEKIKQIVGSLDHEFCTYCWYCLPCPKNIPIPQYLSAWNIARLEGKRAVHTFINENIVGLKNLNSLAKDCTECGSCNSKCTQKLDVMSILKVMGQDYDEFIISERSKKNNPEGRK